MSGTRQAWLVARRELRERLRSKGFWAGTALMLAVVVAAIVVPGVVGGGRASRDVGFAGGTPQGLPALAVAQGDAVDVEIRLHRFDDPARGEDAVRDGDIDVLVVDARLLQWRAEPDDRLRALLTGAIQLLVVQERAAAAGISPAQLAELTAPVPIEDVRLGIAEGRSPDDEAAAYVTSILLLVALATYGQLVLTGVVQEKASRVVEVLLARMPARTLLAGKIGGIGLLGFAQFAVTAVVALVATLAVGSVDLPSVSGDVLAWVVAWFVLGYALYAVAYGTFGSLASRMEDASTIAAPATTVLVVGYWAAFMAVSRDPEGGWARLASLVPASAPFAMPARVALGATAWWEPVAGVALSLAAIAGLAVVAGRVYSGAILHGGPTLQLRDAWRRGAGTTRPGATAVAGGHGPPSLRPSPAAGPASPHQANLDRSIVVPLAVAAACGGLVFVLARDVIWAVAAAAASYAAGSRLLRAWRHPAR